VLTACSAKIFGINLGDDDIIKVLTFASERLVIGIFFGHGLQLRSDFFLRYLLQHQ
jgi:hypothetical protein